MLSIKLNYSYITTLLQIASLIVAILAANAHSDIFDELDSSTSSEDYFAAEDRSASNDSVPQADSKKMTLEEEFEIWKAAEDAEFNEWKEKYFAELNAYKDKILKVWDKAEVTNNTSWVQYSEDLSTKKVIDYENNEIRVSITGDGSTPSEKEIQNYVEEILNTTPNEARKKDPVLVAVGESAPSQDTSSNKSLLAELTEEITVEENQEPPKESGSPTSKPEPEATSPKSTPSAPTTIAKKLSRSAEVKQETSSSNKKVTTITVKLPNDATFKRSRAYADEVSKRAKEHKMDPSLIFAIMHTESSFNPMARSPIPAFGLMQIVPGSAGKDVTQEWYGQAKLLQPNELFNAQTNIRAGATYLSILYYRYLKGVTDPESRKYCVIAAYNTGAGNVSKAFIGSRKIRNAFPEINKLTPQQVYETLITQLPYDETRKYLERVTKRQAAYQQL